VRYLVIAEAKAAAQPPVDPAVDAAAAPAPGAPPVDPNATPAHEWAGDLVDDRNEVSDPANAFAHFTGQENEEAWLDKATDGTLTGWVRDADGSIYRYSDVDAWAVDVDDAQMTRSDSPAADPEATPADPQAEPAGAATDGATNLFADVQGKSLVAVRTL
jgi:hypothetical protein